VSNTSSLLICQRLNSNVRPILFVQKAQQKRKETGDARFFAPLEKQTFNIVQRLEHVLALPFKILFHEPMLIAITVYMSVRINLKGLRYHSTDIGTLVRLWMSLPTFRGISHSIYRRAPPQSWCFWAYVHTSSCGWCDNSDRGMFMSSVIACLLSCTPYKYIFIFNPRYEKEVARCAPHPVPPEFRLEMAMFASPFFAISFFWFA